MAHKGRVGGRDTARLLALCAVLFGLFLMHGAPATAAEGCHGAISVPAEMRDHLHGGPSAMAPGTMHPGPHQASVGPTMHATTTCVSTPPRAATPLTTPGLLAIVAVVTFLLLAGGHRSPGQVKRRGPPPPGGRSMLLRVCVART